MEKKQKGVLFMKHRVEISTPQPIDTKFETGDYVRETTPCVKFRANPSIEGFSANG